MKSFLPEIANFMLCFLCKRTMKQVTQFQGTQATCIATLPYRRLDREALLQGTDILVQKYCPF